MFVLAFALTLVFCLFLVWLVAGSEMRLNPPFTSKEEREFLRNIDKREQLDDEEFARRYYSGTAVAEDIPAKLRSVMEVATGIRLAGLHPTDNFGAIDDLDFSDVFYRINAEFDVQIPPSALTGEIDGTFDSLARYISKVKSQSR